MKKLLIWAILITLYSTSMAQNKKTDPYKSSWDSLHKASEQGLIKEAMLINERILHKAKSESNSQQYLKAATLKINLINEREENGLLASIQFLEQELTTAKFPVKNLLHHHLASLYDDYYSRNKWQISQRTEIDASAQGSDIDTWTSGRFFAQVNQHIEASLDQATELQKIKVEDYDTLIVKTSGRKVRPTLFDFLAFEAFNHYDTQYERDLSVSQSFQLSDPAYFADGDKFVALKPQSSNSLSAKYNALLLIQRIVSFRRLQPEVPALIDAELIRLDFVNKIYTDKAKGVLYHEALTRLEQKYASDTSVTEVSHRIASYYQSLGNTYSAQEDTTHRWALKKAIEKCQEAIKKHPKTYGAARCAQLIEIIKEQQLSFEGESVISPGKPFKMYTRYKNLKDLEFKFYKISHAKLKSLMSKEERNDLELSLLKQHYTQLYKNKPAYTKAISLPQTDDFQQHSVELPFEAMAPGLYLMYVGPKGFPKEGLLTYEVVQVSSLGYLENNTPGQKEIYVVNNTTGMPVEGVKVQVWKEYYDYSAGRNVVQKIMEKATNAEGKVVASGVWGDHYGTFYVNILGNKDSLYNDLPHTNQYTHTPLPRSREQTPYNEVKILTDRAIYRPGQTVYYKIIAFSRTGNKAEVLPSLAASISLRDVNQKELGKQTFTTNEFGAAHGSFMLPASGLTGYHNFEVTGNNIYGSQGILVEEYKRPKFEVKFDTLKSSYKLNEEVSVTLSALSYAGANVDQAKVSYKVNRTFRYPEYWYKCGFYWLPTPTSTQIAVGETSTQSDGKALITFKAIPDVETFRADKAIFTYEIIADVTDINGETRSATTYVSLGQAGFQINTSIPEKVFADHKAKLAIQVQNFNDVDIKNTADVEIFKLQDPDKYFKPRYWPRPSQFVLSQKEHDALFPDEIYDAENLALNYPIGKSAYRQTFTNEGMIEIPAEAYQSWTSGAYLVTVKAQSATGERIEEKFYFTLENPASAAKHSAALVSLYFNRSNFVPQEQLQVQVHTQQKQIRLFYQYASETQQLNQWLPAKGTHDFKYTLAAPGYVNAVITYIWNNRTYTLAQSAFVSNVDKELLVKFETFRDKLLPGQKETWKLNISGYKGQKVHPEFLALLYDASLDQFASHNINFNYSSYGSQLSQATVGNIGELQYPNAYSFAKDLPYVGEKSYDTWKYFNKQLLTYMAMGNAGAIGRKSKSMRMESVQMLPPQVAADQKVMEKDLREAPSSVEPQATAAVEEAPKAKEEPQIRKNFQETAFFYPSLHTDSSGSVTLNFTIPEALTRWQMYGLAHTKDMKLGFISNQLVTQKDLMVSPNVPRFFREGDAITLQAKVNNMTDKPLSATAKVEFFDAVSMKPLPQLLVEADKASTSLKLEPKQSKIVEWNIQVPEAVQAITYRVYAQTDTHSDAEENTVIVLSNKLLVTETLPINVPAGKTKAFKMDKLETNASGTLRHHALTFEYTSNPAWYAVQALPYLMEYPYECAEQVFSRYYANDLASYISNKHPRIKRVFDAWRASDSKALLSNLEKNQELKQLMIEETPWLRDAQDETESKKRIALLFDVNKMGYEKSSSLQKLQKMQFANGAFPWFQGMYPDRFITQHIAAGIGHLQQVKGATDDIEHSIAYNALSYLDQELVQDLKNIKKLVAEKKTTLEENHLDYVQIHYLYTRSFFTKEQTPQTQEAHRYYLGQAEKYALKQNRYAQGMIALALFRAGKAQAAQALLKSIAQYALESEEMGMYWKESYGYSWYQAPIESQALMIEAFSEITNDAATVDKLKVWLLKQKQTTRWATTKATSEACYALLLKGSDFLVQDVKPTIKLGTKALDIPKGEEGTGYFKIAIQGKDVDKNMASVTVSNNSQVVNWGALYWQYFEKMDKVSAANTSVSIEKTLYLHQRTDKGDKLVPISEAGLKVGDLVTVRLVIKSDRNLEYVHLKDMRAAGFEPVNVVSGYRWKAGLGFYESTRDATTNFFISYLPKGSYVFEYPLRVAHKGDFFNGITSLQCMYAPEFTSHSEGLKVLVK